jgi:hypothetical protein
MSAEGARVVRIRCHGGKVGEAINATGYFRAECRQKRCAGPNGEHPVHVWDLSNGWLVDEPMQQTPETARKDTTP